MAKSEVRRDLIAGRAFDWVSRIGRPVKLRAGFFVDSPCVPFRIEPTIVLISVSSSSNDERRPSGTHFRRIQSRSQNRVSASSFVAIAKHFRKSFVLMASSASARFAPTDEPAAANCSTIRKNLPSAASCSATATHRSLNDSARSKNSGFNRPRAIFAPKFCQLPIREGLNLAI